MKSSDDFKEILIRSGLPVPPGEILHLVYRVYNEDWFAKTQDGWLWMDAQGGRERVWVPSLYGPGSVYGND